MRIGRKKATANDVTDIISDENSPVSDARSESDGADDLSIDLSAWNGTPGYAVSKERQAMIDAANEKKARQKKVSLIAGVIIAALILTASIALSYFVFGPTNDNGLSFTQTELLKQRAKEIVLSELPKPDTAKWPGDSKWLYGRDDYNYAASSYVSYETSNGDRISTAFVVHVDISMEHITYFEFGNQILVDELYIPDEKPIEVPLNEDGIADPKYY